MSTGIRLQLHRPVANLTSYQNGIYYASINIYTFIVLPISIAELVTNKKQFIPRLKKFLIDKSLYSTDEYFKQVM
jgi:hypothetical protein